jgi:fatty acid desaturase
MPDNPSYPIPHRLNLAVAISGAVSSVTVLHLGSQTQSLGMQVGLAGLFAVLMIPLYSLIHEAEHRVAHPDSQINDWLGVALCVVFIAPFTFLKKCHLNHHRHNRTDYEMWDLYYPHQRKWLRRIYLYSIRIGVEWLMVVLSVVMFAFVPRLVFSKLFSWNKEIKGIIKGAEHQKLLFRIRQESWLVIVFQVTMFFLLELQLSFLLMAYLLHAFVWSSQNYVTHAFSPRDIVQGAHNLKMPLWMRILYLNFNLHLAHHQYPKVSWIHLPAFTRKDQQTYSFWQIYLRLWKGPEVTHEPSPALKPET